MMPISIGYNQLASLQRHIYRDVVECIQREKGGEPLFVKKKNYVQIRLMDEMNIKIAWVFQFLLNIADVDVKTMTQERKGEILSALIINLLLG